jgi:Lrp/AsnC family transcriptional regulator for asnA, asnC and gidA
VCGTEGSVGQTTTNFEELMPDGEEIRVAGARTQRNALPGSLPVAYPVPVTVALSHALLDDVGKAIVEQLQQDGRRSYATIARAVGLSEAAVRQRVTRLQEAGVMQVVAVTDPLQLGFRRQAMVGVRVDGEIVRVADALAEMAEVDYVVITAGSFDVLAEAVCEDDDHLLDLVSRRIRGLPGVRSTETFVYMKLRKQHYDWGTR